MISSIFHYLLSLAIVLNIVPASLSSGNQVQAASIETQACHNPDYLKLKSSVDVKKAAKEEATAEKFNDSQIKLVIKSLANDNKLLQKEEVLLKSRTQNDIRYFEKFFKISSTDAFLLNQSASDVPSSPFLTAAKAYHDAIAMRRTVFDQVLSQRRQSTTTAYQIAEAAWRKAIADRQATSATALNAYNQAICQAANAKAAKPLQATLKLQRKQSADTYRKAVTLAQTTLRNSLKEFRSEYGSKIDAANKSFKLLTSKILKDYKQSIIK